MVDKTTYYFNNKMQSKIELMKRERALRYINMSSVCEKKEAINFVFLEIEEVIQAKYGWERTIHGFEKRTNFRFNELDRIEFDVNEVFQCDLVNGFITDGSGESNVFLWDSHRELSKLYDMYHAQDKVLNEHPEPVKEAEDSINRQIATHPYLYNGDIKTYLANEHTRTHLRYFGLPGKKTLLKWLNLLSDSKRTIDELLDDFIKDVNVINIYFEIMEKKFPEYVEFDQYLLQELATYSSRGEYFKKMYKERLHNESKEKKK